MLGQSGRFRRTLRLECQPGIEDQFHSASGSGLSEPERGSSQHLEDGFEGLCGAFGTRREDEELAGVRRFPAARDGSIDEDDVRTAGRDASRQALGCFDPDCRHLNPRCRWFHRAQGRSLEHHLSRGFGGLQQCDHDVGVPYGVRRAFVGGRALAD